MQDANEFLNGCRHQCLLACMLVVPSHGAPGCGDPVAYDHVAGAAR